MNAAVAIDGNAMLVKVDGRLDSQSAPELEGKINAALDGIASLTLDFTDLLYIASAGLRVVLACKKKMNAVQGEMTVLNPNEMVMDVFEATGFSDLLDIRQGV